VFIKGNQAVLRPEKVVSPRKSAQEKKDDEEAWKIVPPACISLGLWQSIKEGSDGVPVKKRIWEWCKHHQVPSGWSDPELWKSLPPEFKDIFLEASEQTEHYSKFESMVAKFFLDFEADDFDYESGVNSFALINALALTIPFGVLSSVNNSVWTEIQDALLACPDDSTAVRVYNMTQNENYNWLRTSFGNNAAAACYGSLLGLTLVLCFFLFKPKERTQWARKKMRIFMFLLFICTASAVVGCLCLFNNLQMYITVSDSDLCNVNLYGQSVLKVAMTCLVITVFLGVYLMW
jgi:hypothetical protein